MKPPGGGGKGGKGVVGTPRLTLKIWFKGQRLLTPPVSNILPPVNP